MREIELSGSLLAARRIGNAVHTVVAEGDQNGPGYETWPADLDTCGTEESIVRAKLAALKKENERKLRAKPRFPTIRDGGAAARRCSASIDSASTSRTCRSCRDDQRASIASASAASVVVSSPAGIARARCAA